MRNTNCLKAVLVRKSLHLSRMESDVLSSETSISIPPSSSVIVRRRISGFSLLIQSCWTSLPLFLLFIPPQTAERRDHVSSDGEVPKISGTH